MPRYQPYIFPRRRFTAGNIVSSVGGLRNAAQLASAATSAAQYGAYHLARKVGERILSNNGTDKQSNMPRNVVRTKRKARSSKVYKTRRRRMSTKKRRRTVRRGKKRAAFSTKGFRIIDREVYSMDTTATVQGDSSFYTWYEKHGKHLIDGRREFAGIHTYPVGLTSAGANAQHAYCRLISNLESFMSTSSIYPMFNKYKINWIKHTFIFPDQAADTTNTGPPVRIGINYGDKYRSQWDSTLEEGQNKIPVKPEQFFERPGWKWYNIKRMNKLTIKFAPTYTRINEHQTVAGVTADAPYQKKGTWFNTDTIASDLEHVGPTIAFEFASPLGTFVPDVNGAFTTGKDANSQAERDANSNWWTAQINATPFLKYTRIVSTASISFKDRTQQADD